MDGCGWQKISPFLSGRNKPRWLPRGVQIEAPTHLALIFLHHQHQSSRFPITQAKSKHSLLFQVTRSSQKPLPKQNNKTNLIKMLFASALLLSLPLALASPAAYGGTETTTSIHVVTIPSKACYGTTTAYPVEEPTTYPVETPVETYPVETHVEPTYPVETHVEPTYPSEEPTYPVETPVEPTYPVETPVEPTYPVETPVVSTYVAPTNATYTAPQTPPYSSVEAPPYPVNDTTPTATGTSSPSYTSSKSESPSSTSPVATAPPSQGGATKVGFTALFGMVLMAGVAACL